MLPFGSTIGILGGGQLGRMMSIAAAELGYHVHIFTPEQDSPAAEVSKYVSVADYKDQAALIKFASSVDVVTLEFENIPLNAAREVEKLKILYPSSIVLEICQHRVKEKEFVNGLGIKTAPFRHVQNWEQAVAAIAEIGTPCILKTCTLGYDGKGQVKVTNVDELETAWKQLQSNDVIMEGYVDFAKEISVIIARNTPGDISYYPPVQNIHKNHILHQTIAPAPICDNAADEAVGVAKRIAEKLELAGILAIEMFVLKDGSIAVNELAPRPHNSGHWTLDAAQINQFELTIRAAAGLPLPGCHEFQPAVMTNLIGDDVLDAAKYLAEDNTSLHLYGKKEARFGRKMGHVTQLISKGKV